MRVAIPHSLDQAEVRRRIKGSAHEIADALPGGARISTSWPSEDQMRLDIGVMGQSLLGAIEIEAGQVVISIDLPPLMALFEPMIQSALAANGRNLLT